MKIEPENVGPNIKSIKFLGSGIKARVGQVSGNNHIFRPNYERITWLIISSSSSSSLYSPKEHSVTNSELDSRAGQHGSKKLH